VRDDAAVTVAAQLFVVCPDPGRVGFVDCGADDVVELGDPGRNRRVALGEPADRGLSEAQFCSGYQTLAALFVTSECSARLGREGPAP
jgi:hypothetical protein